VQQTRLILAATVMVAALVSPIAGAEAQQAPQGGNQQWFVPGGGGQAPRGGPPQQRPQAQPRPQAAPAMAPPPPQEEPEPPPLQVQLPPLPDLPPLARGSAPPATVMGVLSAREVFRSSAAAQQLERVLGERREKFNADVQKEQAAWREMQQSFANQRANMSPEQIRAKERELQDRVTNAQRQFRDRQRILQQATEYAGQQIERGTILVVRQVAESRGINVVLHREQVALNAPEFDLTEAVILQLNKVLPSVLIPPDGVSLAQFPPAIPPAQPAGATPPLAAPARPGPTIAPVNAPAPATLAPATPAPATPAPATPAPGPRR